MSAHPVECEDADVGSLCDCDCAGARHAIRRTKGGVPGAGQVSKRAQKAAQAAGKAPVVNNRAKPSGRAKRDPEPPQGKPPAKPARSTAARPPRLTPTTAAKAHAVRAALPAGREQWQAAAVAPLDANGRRQWQRRVKLARDRQAAADKAIEEFVDHVARTRVVPELLAQKNYGYKGADDPRLLSDARNMAHHRIWDDEGLTRRWYDLQDPRNKAQAEIDAAEKAKVAVVYPVDAKTGLRMPTEELKKHLAAVKDVGRAALADAKAEFDRTATGEVKAAQDLLGQEQSARGAWRELMRRRNLAEGLPADPSGMGGFSIPDPGGSGGARMWIRTRAQYDELLAKHRAAKGQFDTAEGIEKLRQARKTIAGHQAGVLRQMLGEHRTFGGVHHDSARPGRDSATETAWVRRGKKEPYGIADPRSDWAERLKIAEDHFPADWLKVHAGVALQVGSSERAYMGERKAQDGSTFGMLSMPSHARDKVGKDGALDDVDETNVHELGHRFERLIPGLTHLEFAYVRERGVNADGSVQPLTHLYGYDDDLNEVAQQDKWGNAYTGKSYESRNANTPGDESWEVFQTGLQDTFGRSSAKFGPYDDPEELQAFVIGALLTLG